MTENFKLIQQYFVQEYHHALVPLLAEMMNFCVQLIALLGEQDFILT